MKTTLVSYLEVVSGPADGVGGEDTADDVRSGAVRVAV